MINKRKYFFYSGIIVFLVTLFFIIGILVAKNKIGNAESDKTLAATINSEEKVKNQVISKDANGINNEINTPLNGEKGDSSNEIQKSENQPENKFIVGIIGDSQYFDVNNQSGGLQKTSKLLTSKNVDLVIAVGDLLSSCDGGAKCEEKLNNWKNVLGTLFFKTYVVMGNHDRTGGNKADALWQKFFNLPTNGPTGYSEFAYSFDFKNTHFVVLDSEKPKERIVNDIQRTWLEQDLNANIKENTFVFIHDPAYPVSSKIGESLDDKPKERDALWNILAAHNVSAVFNGHEHIASRRKIGNLYQFVFGNTDSFNHDAPKPGVAEYSYVGQSFGVVEVDGKNIIIKTYSTEGKLLDSFKLVK
jgi:predicted phosphodiesterase